MSSHLLIDNAGIPGILLTPNSLSAPSVGTKTPSTTDGGDDDDDDAKDESHLRGENEPDPTSFIDEASLRSRSIVTADEISRMRLSASVVVLSFGHSSVGNSQSAEEDLLLHKGLAAIVDAFVNAGAKSVLVSVFTR